MTCPSGKTEYPSPQRAYKALRLLDGRKHHRKPRAWNHGKVGAYHCQDCGSWHITSSHSEARARA